MLPLQSTKTSDVGGKSYFLFILVAIVAIGSGLIVQSSKSPPAGLPEFKKAILLPSTKPLIDADFIDHNGNEFGIEQFKGKWSILFFGFTNCPDVCPTTMQTLKQVKAKVKQAGMWHNYRVIMVSVDPERDTTERLANYVPYFDPEFVGISGPVEATTSFAKNVGILFFKGDEAANGGYDVDHGAALILVNPEGEYAGVITAPHIETTISEDLIALARYAGVKPVKPSKVSDRVNNEQANPSVNDSDSRNTLVFENAWIRPAPPGVQSMAAYFDLHNNSDHDIVLDQSSSSAFAATMIHTTSFEDGISSMHHLDELIVPARGKVRLAPLGIHMMLMGPKNSLNLGDSAEIQLIDNNGVRYSHTVTVKQQPDSEAVE